MEHSTVDNTISLIYFWLKENKLSKTCKSLEEEYGKKIQERDASLNKIIETYQAMSVLMSAFNQLPTNKKAQTVSNRKRRNSTSSTKTSGGDPHTTATNTNEAKTVTMKTGKNTIPVIPKKKKVPVFPPGVWICPEMENKLCDLYDRMPPALAPTIDLSKGGSDDVTKDGDEGNASEVIDIDVHLPSAVVVKNLENLSMFTSDSESDSDNEILKTAGIDKDSVLESPHKPGKPTSQEVKQADNPQMIHDSTIPFDKLDEKPDEKSPKRKSKKLLPIKQKVFDDSNNENVVSKSLNNISTGLVKKKKKKHKPNTEDLECSPDSSFSNDAPKSPNLHKEIQKRKDEIIDEVDICSQDSGIGMVDINGSPEMESKIKKKKKKQKLNPGDNETNQSIISNCIEKNIDSSAEVKKKKKKHKPHITDNIDIQRSVDVINETENHENVLDVTEQTVKKKKKKSKIDTEVKDRDETIMTQPKAIIGNDETLNNLGDVLKKKKKKKHVDIGS